MLSAFLIPLAGCSHIPFFKRWARKAPFLPYQADPMFSCQYPRRWLPELIEGGVRFREPKGRAHFSIIFVAKDEKGYKPPDELRREMAAWGSTEDPHLVSDTLISSHTAFRVRYTRYEYDPQYLLGEKARVSLAEASAVPDPRGVFLILYRAGREDFWRKKYRAPYLHFLNSLLFSPLPEE